MPDENPAVIGRSGEGEVERFKRRFEQASKIFDNIAPHLDDAYKYILPQRERPFGSTGEGADRTDELFDETAPFAAQAFASQMMEDTWPSDQEPFDLKAGPEIPENEQEEVNRALVDTKRLIIQTINNSNFRNAAHEADLDYSITTAILLINEGDALMPVRFECLPAVRARLDVGPDGDYDALFRERNVKAGDLPLIFPRLRDRMEQIDAMLRKDISDNPDKEFKVTEGYERDWSRRDAETWIYRAAILEKKVLLDRSESRGNGSKPFVAYNFMQVPGEVWGRGPGMLMLPAIKTVNKVQELLLENADIAVVGMWLYDDDGVINPDTIEIAPGTLIPRTPGGSGGLEPVRSAGDPNLAQFIIADIQRRIQEGFFRLDLGPTNQTPRTATEILERSADRARRMAGPVSRRMTEFMGPLVRRVAWILKRQGRLPGDFPAIDGRDIRLQPLAPITRSQAQDDILRHDQFLQLLTARFGPTMVAMKVKPNEYVDWLADKMGFNPQLINTEVEQEQLVNSALQAAQAAPGLAAQLVERSESQQ